MKTETKAFLVDVQFRIEGEWWSEDAKLPEGEEWSIDEQVTNCARRLLAQLFRGPRNKWDGHRYRPIPARNHRIMYWAGRKRVEPTGVVRLIEETISYPPVDSGKPKASTP
jgi:hypothetical protein